MANKSFAGLVMSLALSLFCCFLFVYGEEGSKYDEEAGRAYLKKINADIQVKSTENALASWAYESNITDENLRLQLQVSAKLANYTKEIWKETTKYPWKTFKDPDVKRQFQKFSVLGTAILSPEKYETYNKIISDMQSIYGKAKICNYHERKQCSFQIEPELTEIFAQSRDPDELRYYWEEWRNSVGRPVRNLFKEYVDLANEAAGLNNFTDTAEYWLKDYESEDFREQVEALWEQVKPLYLQLHAYVRRRLRDQYGEAQVSQRGPIPAHLLGNMWAQSWGNTFNFTVPYPEKPSLDLTPNMIKQGYTPLKMFQLAEEFFTSLNLSPMPDTFWKNSILEKPKDGRDLICHASAWDFYDGVDFRIKQCTRVHLEDLQTVHHEMGHVQYFLQYKNQPLVYKDGANQGFHEAVGDVMALSVSTPKHLRKIGLLESTDDDEKSDINQLFGIALEKIAFLPFGYLMDEWRWSVFQGKVTNKDYNSKWWELREKYQGLSPPVPRTENDFDPGAKFHTIANVPYIRYFVSFIIQFQFHRSLCMAANEYDPNNPSLKPLHKCDIYQSKEAGALIKKMLQMGSSKPWPEAMLAITGESRMDAGALLDYFATLQSWLEQENQKTGQFIGWESCDPVTKRASATADKAPSSHIEGSFEDGNIAFSYAELVRPDENTFGVPDYLEEVKHFHRSLLHRPKDNSFKHSYFLPAKQDIKTVDDRAAKRSYQEADSNEIDLSKVQILRERLQKQPWGENPKSDKLLTQSAYDMCKAPKSNGDRKELGKTKVLNAILKDLHQMRATKGEGGQSYPISYSTEHYKGIYFRDTVKNEKKPESIDKDTEEKLQKAREEAKKKVKVKEKEITKLEKGEGEVLNKSKEEKSKAAVDDSKAELHKPEKQKDSAVVDSKNTCILDKAKNMKFKTLDMHIPNIELMWEAELVRSEAEQMLKNLNFSAKSGNTSAANKTPPKHDHFDAWLPSYQNNIPDSSKNKKSRNVQDSKRRFSRLEDKVDWDSFEKSLLTAKLGSLKTNLNDQKRFRHAHFKEFSLVDVIPIRDLFDVTSGYEGGEFKSEGKNLPDTYLMMVGKLVDKDGQSDFDHRRFSKKSYKEFHYNARTPILYNAVVITTGKNDKPEDAKDHWSAIMAKMTSPSECRDSLGVAKFRKRRRNHEAGKKYKKRLSRNVKRRKININNILQYFGLTTPFVITFYSYFLVNFWQRRKRTREGREEVVRSNILKNVLKHNYRV